MNPFYDTSHRPDWKEIDAATMAQEDYDLAQLYLMHEANERKSVRHRTRVILGWVVVLLVAAMWLYGAGCFDHWIK